jgi:hypothetical protein
MKKVTVLLSILTLVILGTSAAVADEDPIENAIEACTPEIESYCSQVTPGEGRLLACFYAHEDKLSGRCNWVLYESAAQLEQFAVAITHLARQCRDDLVKFCAEVEMGEGRVASCLLKHQAEVSKGCSQAIVDVELEVVD